MTDYLELAGGVMFQRGRFIYRVNKPVTKKRDGFRRLAHETLEPFELRKFKKTRGRQKDLTNIVRIATDRFILADGSGGVRVIPNKVFQGC